jgi:hypothetical protein
MSEVRHSFAYRIFKLPKKKAVIFLSVPHVLVEWSALLFPTRKLPVSDVTSRLGPG